MSHGTGTHGPGLHGKGILSPLRTLASDTRGNVIAIAAASILPMLAIIGGTVDMSRAYMAQSQLQSACDAGVLAGRRALGRSGSYGTAESAKATNMFNANFEPAKLAITASSFVSSRNSDDNINGTATATLPTMIMGIFNFQNFSLEANCLAELQLANTDVMFVLDTTGSMAGAPINGLRQAVRDFHATLSSAEISPQTRVRYGFVPYSTTVNARFLLEQNHIPASFFGDSATYSTRESQFNTQTEHVITYNGAATYGADETNPNYVFKFDCDDGWGVSDRIVTATGSGSSKIAHWYEKRGYVEAGTYQGYSYGTCKRRKVSRPADTRTVFRFTQYVYHEAPVSTVGVTGFDDVSLGSHGSNAWVETAGTYDVRELAAFTTTNSSGISITNSAWNGCVMERQTVNQSVFNPIPLGARDLDIINAPTSGTAGSYWAPLWQDIISRRDTTSPDPEVSKSKYSALSGDSNACPAEMRPFTTVEMTSPTVPNWLESYLGTLNAEGFTYHDIGMVWGARVASPRGIMAANVNDEPDKSATRHLVFMTDGAMVVNRDAVNAYGLERYANRIAPQNTNNNDISTRHSARFRAACNLAKNEGYTIWIVAFGTSVTTDMTFCATGDRVFYAADPASLSTQFQAIASQIADLRLGA